MIKNPILKWTLFGLLLLGIGYNLILPFTPLWLDVVVWILIAAMLLCLWIKKQISSTSQDHDAPPSNEENKIPRN
jgi:membrane protein implicated in regulation of membrane protease activity